MANAHITLQIADMKQLNVARHPSIYYLLLQSLSG